jgi:prolyl oligopeptidase
MPPLRYPPTRRGDDADDHHGTVVADPYRWLEDTDGEETRAWVAAQNALSRAWLDQVPARARIRERLGRLWDHPRRSVPWRRGERWFQLRNAGLQDQDVLWTMDGPQDEGRVLLDPNALGAGTVALAEVAASRDGALLAYALSEAGSDWRTWHVLDVAAAAPLPDEAPLRWSKFSPAAWAPDGSGFFYGRYPAPAEGRELREENRDQRLCFHRLGTPQSADVVVHARPDQPEWGFDPQVTEDGRWLVLHAWQGTDRRNRLFVADLSGFDPRAPADLDVVPLLDAFDAAYHAIDSVGTVLYVRTDRDAPRGRVVAVRPDRPEPEAWTEIVAERDATLERVELVGGRLVALYLDDARHRLQRFALDGRDEGALALPGVGTVGALAGRPGDPAFHFSFTTFTAPVAVCGHDLRTGETRYVAEPGLAIDESAFTTEQVFVTSTDGARVPMFLVRRADLDEPGDGAPVDVPTLLYGYGGYGIPLTPAFSVAWFVWLELGGQLAVANLRGGGEYGEEWHAAGRGPRKQQVFDDFLACARALVDSGWTTPARLAITGGSNGGLLVGACMTQRPELFGACVPEVGVFDMLRFHRFTIGWAWVSEYGSADDPDQFKTLLAYSPLHNVWPRTAYPPTLVVTGDHDDRVVPAHSFKFAAALQAAQAGDAPVLLRTTTDAGHGAGKPTRVSIEERADVLAFLVRALDLEG